MILDKDFKAFLRSNVGKSKTGIDLAQKAWSNCERTIFGFPVQVPAVFGGTKPVDTSDVLTREDIQFLIQENKKELSVLSTTIYEKKQTVAYYWKQCLGKGTDTDRAFSMLNLLKNDLKFYSSKSKKLSTIQRKLKKLIG